MNELCVLLAQIGFEVRVGEGSGYKLIKQKIPKFKGWREVCRMLFKSGIGFKYLNCEYSTIEKYPFNSMGFYENLKRKEYTVLETQLTEDMTKMIPELKSVIERNN